MLIKKKKRKKKGVPIEIRVIDFKEVHGDMNWPLMYEMKFLNCTKTKTTEPSCQPKKTEPSGLTMGL